MHQFYKICLIRILRKSHETFKFFLSKLYKSSEYTKLKAHITVKHCYIKFGHTFNI